MVENNIPKTILALKELHRILEYIFSQKFPIGDGNCLECIVLRFLSLSAVSTKLEKMFLPLSDITHNCAIIQFFIKSWVILSAKGIFIPAEGHTGTPQPPPDDATVQEFIKILKLSAWNSVYNLIWQQFVLGR